MLPRPRAAGRRRVLVGVASLAVAGSAFGLDRARRALGVAAGYAAKVVASGIFVSGRTPESLLEEELRPEGRLEGRITPLLDVEVDREALTVRVSAAGLVRRVAACRAALGCSLALGTTPAALRAQGRRAAGRAPEPPPGDWPEGEPGTPVTAPASLERALDASFAAGGSAAGARALVVVHRGRLVGERYAAGYGPATPLPGWSMAKSVTGALVGIQLDRSGRERDAPTGLAEWAGDGRAAIRISQLLQMSSGLDFEERYDGLLTDAAEMLFASHDAAGFALRRPLAAEPGSRWQYSSGSSNLLSLLLRRWLASDEAYWRFPREALFDRIGMRSAVFETDASGTFVGSSFLYATARDWARFGLLLQQGGVWQGQRVLPAGWVEWARRPAPQAPLGRYGGHLWLNAGSPGDPEQRPLPGLPPDLFYLAGFQGQRVLVLPSSQLVVVRLGLTRDESLWDEAELLEPLLTALAGPSD